MFEGDARQFDMFDEGVGGAKPQPPREIEPLGDADLPGCVALLSSIVLRALHDACGVTITSRSPANKLATARAAWTWLHAGSETDDHTARSALLDMAGFEPSRFDKQISTADIPWPTHETLANPTLILERVYWRLAGRHGPEPDKGLYQSGRRKRPTTRKGRDEVRSLMLRTRNFALGSAASFALTG